MDELRFKKLEFKVNNHNRRLDEHDAMHLHAEKRMDGYGKDIHMLQEILKENQKTNELISEVVVYAQKTYDVVKPLTAISGYVIKLGALAVAVWHGIKFILAKLAIVS